jgi:hypothetical protein
MPITATVTKMPAAEVIAAQTGTETAAQVAKRLGVTYHFVKNTLVGQNWNYILEFTGAEWRSMRLCDMRARLDARRATRGEG